MQMLPIIPKKKPMTVQISIYLNISYLPSTSSFRKQWHQPWNCNFDETTSFSFNTQFSPSHLPDDGSMAFMSRRFLLPANN